MSDSATTPAPHPQPHAHPQPNPGTGAGAWWAFFLALIPFPPILPVFIWVGVAWGIHRKHRGLDTPAEVTSRNALNWALTYLLLLALWFAAGIGLLVLVESPGLTANLEPLFIPLGLILLLLGIMGWVNAIVGGVRAGRHEPFRARPTIPFVRRRAAPGTKQLPG